MTNLTGPKNLLVAIDDHFGRTQKFASDYCHPPVFVDVLLSFILHFFPETVLVFLINNYYMS